MNTEPNEAGGHLDDHHARSTGHDAHDVDADHPDHCPRDPTTTTTKAGE